MPKPRKSADPFAARESKNYENPIPSREFILEHLEGLGAPASFSSLCEQLELDSEERIEGPVSYTHLALPTICSV